MVVPYKSPNMKDISLLRMVVLAFVLFIVGVAIRGTQNPWHIILVTAGMVIGYLPLLNGQRAMTQTEE